MKSVQQFGELLVIVFNGTPDAEGIYMLQDACYLTPATCEDILLGHKAAIDSVNLEHLTRHFKWLASLKVGVVAPKGKVVCASHILRVLEQCYDAEWPNWLEIPETGGLQSSIVNATLRELV